MGKMKEGGKIMQMIKFLFLTLIDAMDVFLDAEENEVGCLTEKEHSEILAMRNRIDEIFMKKLKKYNARKDKKKKNESLAYFFFSMEGDDDMELRKKKSSNEMQF